MPPKKTMTAKKGTQAKGQTSPHIIELPPFNPPSPGSSNSSEGSCYEAPSGDLATTLTLLAQSLSALKKSSEQTKVWEPDVFDGSDTHKLQPFLVQPLTSEIILTPSLLTVLKSHLHCLISREPHSTGSNHHWPLDLISPGLMTTLTLFQS